MRDAGAEVASCTGFGPPVFDVFNQENKPTFRDGKPWPQGIVSNEGQGREGGLLPINGRMLFDHGVNYGYCTDTTYNATAALNQELKTLNLVFSPTDIIKIMGPNSAKFIDRGDGPRHDRAGQARRHRGVGGQSPGGLLELHDRRGGDQGRGGGGRQARDAERRQADGQAAVMIRETRVGISSRSIVRPWPCAWWPPPALAASAGASGAAAPPLIYPESTPSQAAAEPSIRRCASSRPRRRAAPRRRTIHRPAAGDAAAGRRPLHLEELLQGPGVLVRPALLPLQHPAPDRRQHVGERPDRPESADLGLLGRLQDRLSRARRSSAPIPTRPPRSTTRR